VGIDLCKDIYIYIIKIYIFNHGQFYVAFSRIRSWQTLKVYLGSQRDNKQVKNYIYKEIYI